MYENRIRGDAERAKDRELRWSKLRHTTNAVESLNAQLRKVLRNRGPFPSEDAVFTVLFLAIQNAETRWRASKNWTRVLSQLDIFFEGRLPA